MILSNKPFRSFLPAVALLICAAPAKPVLAAANRASIVVGARPALFQESPTVDEDGQVLAPVDFVRLLGADIYADDRSRSVIVTSQDGRKITCRANRVNDRYIVAVRPLALQLGAEVFWDDSSRTMTLRAKVLSVRENGGKLEIATSFPVVYSTGALNNPNRVFVDLVGADLGAPASTMQVGVDDVTQIRCKQMSVDVVRVALDVTRSMHVAEPPLGAVRNIEVVLPPAPGKHSGVTLARVPAASVVPSQSSVRADQIAAAPGAQPDVRSASIPVANTIPTKLRITNVAWKLDNGKRQVVVTTVGKAPLSAVRSSTFNGRRPRLAIDLPNAIPALDGRASRVDTNDVLVKDIRIGTVTINRTHYGRVVLDMSRLSSYQVAVADTSDGVGSQFTITIDDPAQSLSGNGGPASSRSQTASVVPLTDAAPTTDQGSPGADTSSGNKNATTGADSSAGAGASKTGDGPDAAPPPAGSAPPNGTAAPGGSPGVFGPPQRSDSPEQHFDPKYVYPDHPSDSPLNGRIIVIDPGHGGQDSGAPGANGLYEKNLTLVLAKQVRDMLVANGVTVVMTRGDDTFIPLPVRSQMGIDAGADFFVSIHCDSGNYRNALSGSTVYFHANNSACKLLARDIAARLSVDDIGIHSDGTKSDYIRFPGVGFSVLRRSPEPAVLVECGYVNNDADAAILTDPDKQKLIAASIVAGVKDYVSDQLASR